MNEKTHIDLFSGIGGFSLAAAANGIRTVQFVEIDKRCREFLGKAWPGVPIHDDIRTFHWHVADGEGQRRGEFEPWRGPEGRVASTLPSRIYLLSAGVPCQPASCAGKRRGSDDYRWLWPEALRVLSEVRPAWALFENVAGLRTMGLDGILAEVEAAGYEVGTLDIPACAVDAPHRRARLWIVAHRTERGRERMEQPTEQGRGSEDCGRPDFWSDAVWLPCADGKVRRAPDDSFGLVDGLHRSVLGALGNSILPEVAERVIAAMVAAGW